MNFFQRLCTNKMCTCVCVFVLINSNDVRNYDGFLFFQTAMKKCEGYIKWRQIKNAVLERCWRGTRNNNWKQSCCRRNALQMFRRWSDVATYGDYDVVFFRSSNTVICGRTRVTRVLQTFRKRPILVRFLPMTTITHNVVHRPIRSSVRRVFCEISKRGQTSQSLLLKKRKTRLTYW